MTHKASNRCSVCEHPDFRRCGCPWGRAFADWPAHLKDKLMKLVHGGPRQGS